MPDTVRVFEDEVGRLWSAAPTLTPQGSEAALFTCINDARESPRALAVPPELRFFEASVDDLRAMLRQALRIARL